MPVPGLGFRRGSYKCACKKGFYFPDTVIPVEERYFNGSEIEVEYERNFQVSQLTMLPTYYVLCVESVESELCMHKAVHVSIKYCLYMSL